MPNTPILPRLCLSRLKNSHRDGNNNASIRSCCENPHCFLLLMNLTAHKRQGLRELMKTLPVFQRTATLPSMMSGLRLFARAVLVVALTCGGAPAQDAASIKVLQRQTLGADEIYKQHATPHAARHELNLALVYFSGSSWTRDAILAATGKAAEILGPCRVRLARAELILVDAPQQYQYFQTLVSRELARTLQPAKSDARRHRAGKHPAQFSAVRAVACCGR